MSGAGQPASEARQAGLLSRPDQPFVRALLASPILLYRLGLGGLVGRLVLVLTTRGRRTGLPRHTAIEYHRWRGRIHVLNAFGMASDWYRNLLADPHVTVRTAAGNSACVARPLTTDAERQDAWAFVEASPGVRALLRRIAPDLSRETFVTDRERWIVVAFDPTDEPGPPGLEIDLPWVLPALAVSFGVGWLTRGWRDCYARRWRD
jgi:deazaflavin-dependent oxidoreductase (nitroreductase family)